MLRKKYTCNMYLVAHSNSLSIGTPANVDILSFSAHSVRGLTNLREGERVPCDQVLLLCTHASQPFH